MIHFLEPEQFWEFLRTEGIALARDVNYAKNKDHDLPYIELL